MNDHVTETLRIQPSHPPSQGAWVVIEAADYDPARHVLHTPPAEDAESGEGAPPPPAGKKSKPAATK